MKVLKFIFIFFITFVSYGQIVNKNWITKNISTEQDTITLEKVAISPINFSVKDSLGNIIPSNKYYFNPQKSKLFFYNKPPKIINVGYFKYPAFLTKTYSSFDKSLIIAKATPSAKVFSLKNTYNKTDFFGDLETYGNLTRGITVGNNQGSIVNSGLDLQITGNLSKELKIRASIKDSNLPIQENGISQNINEFDRVFIELFTNTWNIKAGDVDLQNTDSYFMGFTKKINGAKLDVNLDKDDQKTFITASGALVKGKFTTQNITATEGNQGPYSLFGINGEQNIVIISGSETVYVNGIVLKRGEQHDYTIDYNTSEITFTPTFPINATQRIIIDFQYSDQNYNRFVTHNGVTYQNNKFTIGTYFYNENDVKSQPVQQNLSDEEQLILHEAGNDTNLMFSDGAVLANFDENRIQYIKTETGQYEYSTDESAILYNVSFGTDINGDYNLDQVTATGNIYVYVGDGIGNFSPKIQLIAPTKLQMAVVKTGYEINKNSFINSEIAYSNNDQNLFSSKDDDQNNGFATTLTWQQQLSNNSWQTNNTLNVDMVHQNFSNIEGLYNAEFNRDWNINNSSNYTPNLLGNQTYIQEALSLKKDSVAKLNLDIDYLKLGNTFTGYRTNLTSFNYIRKAILNTESSYLNNSNNDEKGYFLRNSSSLKYQLKKTLITGLFNYENNHQENINTHELNLNNQKFIKAGINISIGDSTKVYSNFEFNATQTDSVQNNKMVKVQNALNYAIESQLIKTQKTTLKTYLNYRKVKQFYAEDIDVFNGRLQYNQHFLKNLAHWSTVYETSSGSTTQQNYTYIEVEAGQGYYTYLGDLNNNNIKDFNEFEVAQFTDQANYLRVVLPSIDRLSTQKAKLSQSIYINFSQFQNKNSKWLKTLSHFSSQSSILINKDQLKDDAKFNINPFNVTNKSVVGLQQSIRTSLFFNRGLQNYSTSYNYQNNKTNQNVNSNFESATQNISHELNFQHNILSSWIIASSFVTENDINTSSTYNFDIISKKINPSISYINNEFSTLKTNYTYRDEENIAGLENLTSHDFGLEYNYTNIKTGSVITNVNLIENIYSGPVNTNASYRILEGLQPDRNYTWSLILQKKLTELLDLSIAYNGRKNTESNTIHTGSVQLRANF